MKLFVSRHAGAAEWAARHGFEGVRVVPHLLMEEVAAGDQVIGTLPVNLAAEVYRRGATYWHLALDLPAEARGRELTADDMERYGAQIRQYIVAAI